MLISFAQIAFPYLLTAVHALASVLGCKTLRLFTPNTRLSAPAHLTHHDRVKLLAFSLLYTSNIAISNASLSLVSLNLHQVIRALAPAITLILSRFLLTSQSTYTITQYISLGAIVLGVTVCTYSGWLSTTLLGALLTLLGAFLASLKTVLTHSLQTSGRRLEPLQLLEHMALYGLIQSALVGGYMGEASAVIAKRPPGYHVLVILLVNGTLSFALNLASLDANRRCGPLAISIAGNIKQALILLVVARLEGRIVTGIEVVGTGITVVGGISYVIDGKGAALQTPQPLLPSTVSQRQDNTGCDKL